MGRYLLKLPEFLCKIATLKALSVIVIPLLKAFYDLLRSVSISKTKWKSQLWIAGSFANRWNCRLLFKLQEQKKAMSFQSLLPSSATIIGKPLLALPNIDQRVQIVGCKIFTLFSISSSASVLLLLTLCPLSV